MAKWATRIETPEGYLPMPDDIAERLKAMYDVSQDQEICGLIVTDSGDQHGEWQIVPIKNVAKSGKEFAMDQDELLIAFQQRFDNVIGVYHSHPSGNPEPSTEDVVHAQTQWRYFIVTEDGTYEWQINRYSQKSSTMFEVVLLGIV